MALPLVLMATGTAIQVMGQMSANMAEARAELENAKFLEAQAEYARLSAQRAEQLSEVDWTAKYGAQLSAYTGSGVDSSGSAGMTLGSTLKMAVDDLFAIKKKGELDVRLARMRGAQAKERSNSLASSEYNIMQGAARVFSNLSSAAGDSSYINKQSYSTDTSEVKANSTGTPKSNANVE